MRSIRQIRTDLRDGRLDRNLSFLYGSSGQELTAARDRISGLTDLYREIFHKSDGAEVSVYSAPGRTELGGNHTDHQGGEVLTGSVDLDALLCVSPNGAGKIRLYSDGYGMTELDAAPDTPRPEERETTAALVRGILAETAKKGYPVSGFDACLVSDVPAGSGLSSSACVEILLGTAVNGLFCGGALSGKEIARMGQTAENVYFGKPSGLLDQMGCAMGGIQAVSFRDRENPLLHPVRFDFAEAGYALCIISAGSSHEGLTEDYAAIPREMKQAAAVFEKERLSEVDETRFYENLSLVREKAGDRALLRAMHYFEECKRVRRQTVALEKGDFKTFLKEVRDSGLSSFMYLQNVETFRDPGKQDMAAALAAADHFLAGEGAFRVHGGGFAGTIQAYVPLERAAEFKEQMERFLKKGACRITRIRPVGGYALIP